MLMAFNTYNLLQDCTLVKSEADADAGNFAKKDAGFAIKKGLCRISYAYKDLWLIG